MPRTSLSSMTPRRQRGFTMIELMVVIAIVAILAAIAAPSFTPMLERWRVRDATENLQASIFLARSEAIKRGGGIAITRAASAGTCTSGGPTDWACGWTITHVAGGVTTVLQQNTVPPNTQLTLAGSNGVLNLDRWGVLTSGGSIAALTFDVFPKGKTVAHANGAKLCIQPGGRIKSVKGSLSC